MKTGFLWSAAVFVLVLGSLFLPPPCGEAQTTPQVGAVFPDLVLPLPQKAEERNYLGVDEGPFKVSALKGEILIIEIFSMYCPHCQKEAPVVNELFKAISLRPDVKTRVKLIGIGAGNSAYEVNTFRNLYKIQFPLLPDGELEIHKKLGEVGTPYFFVLKNTPSKAREIIYSQVGTIGEPDAFLDKILKKAGPKKTGKHGSEAATVKTCAAF